MGAVEELVWERLVKLWTNHGQLPSAELLAETCNVEVDYAQRIIDRIGTPKEVLEGTKDMPERARLLSRGLELTNGDRNKTYGPPWNNLTDCAQLWEAYLAAKYGIGFSLVAEDVAHMMQLVKITRTFHGAYHDDNYVDNATYGAIAGECRKIEEGR
jgi:hypothetical protein